MDLLPSVFTSEGFQDKCFFKGEVLYIPFLIIQRSRGKNYGKNSPGIFHSILGPIWMFEVLNVKQISCLGGGLELDTYPPFCHFTPQNISYATNFKDPKPPKIVIFSYTYCFYLRRRQTNSTKVCSEYPFTETRDSSRCGRRFTLSCQWCIILHHIQYLDSWWC